MRWTTKHYARLADAPSLPRRTLLEAESWDAIRIDGEDKEYAIPSQTQRWIQQCEDGPFEQRSAELVQLFRNLQAKRIFSAGVGRGCLERRLLQLDPSLSILCSDYAPRTVEALRHRFGDEAVVLQFDMRSQEWPSDVDIYLLHRVDTELDDAQWRATFSRMRRSGVLLALLVSVGTLSLPMWLREQAKRALYLAGDRRFVFAGYFRTRSRLESLWSRTHTLKHEVTLSGGLPAFLLEPLP